MSVYQRDIREPPFSADIVSDAGAYPKRSERSIAPFMANFFWSFILLGGVLILLVHAPFDPPPFDKLTQYTCDPLLDWNRRSTAGLVFTCHSNVEDVFLRQSAVQGMDPTVWSACRRTQGTIRIWRMARHSPYGAMVFHATCGDFVAMYYHDRAKNYVNTQLFVSGIAGVLILLGVSMLALRLHRRHPSILRGLLTPFRP